MTDFILLLIVGACWVWGVHCVFSEGYILERIGNKIRDKVGMYSKPLFDCPPCMSGCHGLFIGVTGCHYWFDNNAYIILPFVLCLCGLNFVIKSIVYPEYE